ncbi:hypothetical protein KSS88_18365 [Bacillus altitudinis]|nr:hypothetical protein [Bacillus altitudinis]MBU8970811.1 hypothetical protein [Bacillus altitudinis]
MNKLKCLTSDDHSAFIPGEVYECCLEDEYVTGRDGWDWYFLPLSEQVVVLCGIDEITFEVVS